MGKLKMALLIVFLVIVLTLGGVAYVGYSVIGNSKTIPAYLTFQSGQVFVDSGNGFQAATNEMELDQNDRIKTGNAKADVVLFESIIIELEENTEVKLSDLTKENTQVTLNTGSIWNKFTGLSGLKDFAVETPTTVASVRGTSFMIKYIDEISEIMVGEGSVYATSEGKKIVLGAMEKAVKKTGEELEKQELNNEEKEMLIQKMKETVTKLEKMRWKEIQKHSKIIAAAKKKYDFDDSDIKNALTQIDRGDLDDAELIQKSPVQLDAMYKIKAMNDAIKKQRKITGMIVKTSIKETTTESKGMNSITGSIVDEPVEMNTVKDPIEKKEIEQDPTIRKIEENTDTKTDDEEIEILPTKEPKPEST